MISDLVIRLEGFLGQLNPHRNAHDPILLAGALPAAAISITITANELQ